MEGVSASRVESWDGMVYDVYVAERYCRVIIQGVSNYIRAYFPQNWVSIPWYVKPNNSVRIAYVGGKVNGRIEIVGPGLTVPTSTGGGSLLQPVAAGEDAILTGCDLIQSGTPRMVVLVKVGTYRIGGVTYTLGPIQLQYGANFELQDKGIIDTIAGAIAINSAPSAGNFRYDHISVDDDGLITYTPGTASSNPVIPAVPGGNIALRGSPVFVPSGTTAIYNGVNIGILYVAPVPMYITMAIDDDDLAWGQTTTDILVSVLDQHGNAINGSGLGWYITVEFLSGNGTIHSDEEGDSLTIIGAHTGTGSSYTFTYTRDGNDPGDVSPQLKAVLHTNPTFQTAGSIILRNAGGDIMI